MSQVSELIGLSFKSTSRHLSVLKNANLVVSRQVNLNNYYSVNDKNIKEFSKFLRAEA